MYGSYKTALYAALLSVVDCEILLLPVHVRVFVLQRFDADGWALQPVKIVPEMTYYVSSKTLNPTHSPIRVRHVENAQT